METDQVELHNDAVAGVVGERFYADRTPDDMVYLTLSSGIGAGVTVDGQVLGGWDGNAGEIGHTIVDPDGRQTCGCGRDGHWEAYCSGENISAYAPLVVAVGGGVALHNPERVLAPVRERLDALSFNNVPALRLTNYGDDVVLRGAAAAAITAGTNAR